MESLLVSKSSVFLRECLSYLKNDEKELIQQHYFEKRSIREIAEIKSETVHAIHIRLQRVLRSLRRVAGVSS